MHASVHDYDLSSFSIFQGFDPGRIEAVWAASTTRELAPEEVLIRSGEANQTLYLLLEGELRIIVEKDGGEVFFPLLPGECLGEMSLIMDRPTSALAVGQQASRVLCIPGQVFWDHIAMTRSGIRNLMATMATHLERANHTLFQEIEEQLAYKNMEAKRLEQEVALRTQKIREDKALIEKQAAELRKLDEMKSQFFTNISHELRTPITLIKTPLEDLLKKYGDTLQEGAQNSLQLILRNAGKLGRLVEELLELSGLEARKASLKETATPLTIFCRRLFSAYASGASIKQIDYQFASEVAEETLFLIDRKRLEKIVNNLLSNALKFTPEGGSIQMRVQHRDKQLWIEVKDTGRGIPPEDLPHIFDRYFQTRRKEIATEGGTGIGLALSRELALLMEGDLEVESEWGGGARFCLHFPAKETALESPVTPLPNTSPEKPQLKNLPPAPSSDSGSKPKILVVEDNPDMQQLIQILLQDDYEAIVANDGAEAWSWLESNDPGIDDIQLILSDVMMPNMDGYALLERIKTHERWQQLPVIMVTARSAEEDKLQALRMGVDDYLLKPFSPPELNARLANLIANYRARKDFAALTAEDPEKVNFAFEEKEGANQTWLQEVEDGAREALEKGIKLTTSFLAEKVFLSERQFQRRIKALTGLTPNGYIQEIKIQKARHLLEHEIYTTVNEVAQACGFSSGSYLTKLYEQHFGKRPSDYF